MVSLRRKTYTQLGLALDRVFDQSWIIFSNSDSRADTIHSMDDNSEIRRYLINYFIPDMHIYRHVAKSALTLV